MENTNVKYKTTCPLINNRNSLKKSVLTAHLQKAAAIRNGKRKNGDEK